MRTIFEAEARCLHDMRLLYDVYKYTNTTTGMCGQSLNWEVGDRCYSLKDGRGRVRLVVCLGVKGIKSVYSYVTVGHLQHNFG